MDGTHSPRWLSDDERRAWLPLVALTVLLPNALDEQLQRDAGLSMFEYGVLAWLSESPQRTLRMSELAVMANSSLSRLSRGVQRLERRGWLRRTPDPEDGRYTLAVLTDEGFEHLAAAAPRHVETVRNCVFDRLTAAQVRQLAEIGPRIVAGVDPDGRMPAPLRDTGSPPGSG